MAEVLDAAFEDFDLAFEGAEFVADAERFFDVIGFIEEVAYTLGRRFQILQTGVGIDVIFGDILAGGGFGDDFVGEAFELGHHVVEILGGDAGDDGAVGGIVVVTAELAGDDPAAAVVDELFDLAEGGGGVGDLEVEIAGTDDELLLGLLWFGGIIETAVGVVRIDNAGDFDFDGFAGDFNDFSFGDDTGDFDFDDFGFGGGAGGEEEEDGEEDE